MKPLLADFSTTDDPINGNVVFIPVPSTQTIKINWNLSCEKIKDKQVGFHIHEYRLSSRRPTCEELGPHWDPTGSGVHGYHLGDLCFNIYFNTRGTAKGSWTSTRELYNYYNQLTNRSLVIHSHKDDKGLLRIALRKKILDQIPLTDKEIESLKTGNAKTRIGCANIEMV